MSADSSFDRAAFQEFLASAYAVQESQIDGRFLSAFLGVQRMVAQGELGLDGLLNLIVDSARDVAGAAGVAIGLLEKDQLIYRAGSGCSAQRIGSRVAASLTVSAKTKPIREILRVENAHTDTRIQGAICRQFGGESLLILPIYRDRMLAGVLEVIFSEAHPYADCEVQMYRLMSGLVEQAMSRAIQVEGSLPAELPEGRRVFESGPKSEEYFANDQPIFSSLRKSNIYVRCEAALVAIQKSPALKRPRLLPEIAVRRATEAIANKPLRSLALSAVAIGLGLSFWLTHGDRGPAPPRDTSGPPRSTAVSSSQPDVIPLNGSSKVPSLPLPVNEARFGTPRARRVRVGQTEVYHIGDDVTVRHFNYTSARPKTASRITYIGKDVTVRYFTPKPAVSSESR